MSSWKEKLQKLKNHHFTKTGLPLLTLVIGMSFLTVDFQRVKYEASAAKRSKRLIKDCAADPTFDLNFEAATMLETTKQINWRNIRGPKPDEDIEGFIKEQHEYMAHIDEAEKRAIKIVTEKREKGIPYEVPPITRY